MVQYALTHRVDRFMGTVAFRRQFVQGHKQMLFVIGHMRSGSSLLVHLLCHNPAIVGYGETHYKYATLSDLYASTRRIINRVGSAESGCRYVLDKVLHKERLPNLDVVQQPYVKVLFLLRRPEEALSSLLKLKMTARPEHALAHYVEQLRWISMLAETVAPSRWMYLTYEELVGESDDTLRSLSRFLNLDTPLTAEYQLMDSTGVAGVGDPGPHIQAGTIKANIKRAVDERVGPILGDAREAYDACVQTLEARAMPFVPTHA